MMLGMSTLETLRADMDRARGKWSGICAAESIDYSTWCRVATGVIKSPRIQTYEKLRAAVDKHLSSAS